MPKLSPVARRVRRFPSTFVALAAALLVAAGCESSSGSDNSVATVQLTPTSPILAVGQLRQLVATATSSSGEILDGQSISWASSAPGVASVDANGLVTAVGGGSTTITATVAGIAATTTVAVQFPVATVTLAPTAGQSSTIRQEGAVQLVPTFIDAAGATVTGRQAAWTSSAPSVARVSASGFVSGLVDGTTDVTIRTNEGVEGTITITVSGAPVVATVTVAPPVSVIGTGATLQMVRTARAASGTIIPGVTTSWASSSASATVDPATGLATGGAAGGTATITATAEGVNGTATLHSLDNLPAGATNVPTIGEDTFAEYAIMIPPGTASFVVAMSGATAGDADLHVYGVGTVTAGLSTNFICRPYLIGSNETCTIDSPAAGGYRVRAHAYPGDGDVEDLVMTVTITAAP